MASSDQVSITIVTYNSGRFIKRCLDSVLDQTYPFKEIIVIDNNSTDITSKVLEAIPRSLPVRCVTESQRGLANARNRAAVEFRGRRSSASTNCLNCCKIALLGLLRNLSSAARAATE